ncbi:MAG TPA: hypothetical protein VGJ42_00395 [Nitrososphaera sp.]|jgi:hypothetical protein
MSDTAIRELDWYLRDHLFRQSNAGKAAFRRESLPSEITNLYLRYRNADLQQLSQLMVPVIDNLVSKKVLLQDGNQLELLGRLARLQCAKCFYINYLVGAEQRTCLRCQQADLHDFPKKA